MEMRCLFIFCEDIVSNRNLQLNNTVLNHCNHNFELILKHQRSKKVIQVSFVSKLKIFLFLFCKKSMKKETFQLKFKNLKFLKRLKNRTFTLKSKQVRRYFKNVCLKVKTGMGLEPKTSQLRIEYSIIQPIWPKFKYYLRKIKLKFWSSHRFFFQTYPCYGIFVV